MSIESAAIPAGTLTQADRGDGFTVQSRRIDPVDVRPTLHERGYAMYARVSRFHGSSGAGSGAPPSDEALAAMRGIPGFRGVISMVDRASGDSLAVTLWESEEAMRASEEQANRMREEMAQAAGDEIRGVERYEVDLFHVEGE